MNLLRYLQLLPIAGTAYIDPCTHQSYVRWTNVPSRFELQESTDLTNWYGVLKMERIGYYPPGFDKFEFPATTNRPQSVFFRIVGPAPSYVVPGNALPDNTSTSR